MLLSELYNSNNYVIIRFNTHKFYIEKLLENLKSNNFNKTLNLISNNNNYLQKYTFEDILKDNHPDIKITMTDSIIEFYLNYNKIDSSLLLLFVESILNYKSYKLPKTSLLYGLLYTLYNFKNIYNIIKTPVSRKYNDDLLHYTKTYSIIGNSSFSRLILTYYDIFTDTINALDKNVIKVGIYVPFDKSNIGMVYFDFKKDMLIKDLDNILKNTISLAYVTNTLNIYKEYLCNIFKINHNEIQNKMDIICSTFVSDNTMIPVKCSIQPPPNMYESVYISIYMRLLGSCSRKEAEVYAAVTTNNSNQKWVKSNFKKYK